MPEATKSLQPAATEPAPTTTKSTRPPPSGKTVRPSMLPLPVPGVRDARQPLLRRLNREILVSERLRVSILAAIPGVLLVLFLAAGTAYPDLLDRVIGKVDRARVGLFLALISAYELWGLQTLEKLIKKDQEPP